MELPIPIPEIFRSLIYKSVPLLKRSSIKLKINRQYYSHIWVKPGEYFDMDDKFSKQKLLSSKIVTLEGWLTRCNNSFRNNEEIIRKIRDEQIFLKEKEKSLEEESARILGEEENIRFKEEDKRRLLEETRRLKEEERKIKKEKKNNI